jgi:two-component SAPR family response regulator
MCWTLARALLAADYIQKLVDKEVLKRVVDNYKHRFQLPESPRANKLCQETMWAYCIDNHTTPEHVCRQFNWMGLAEPSNDSGDDSSYDSSEGDRESNGEEV